ETVAGRDRFVEREARLRARAVRIELRARDAEQSHAAGDIERVEELTRGFEDDRADVGRLAERLRVGAGLEGAESDLQRDRARATTAQTEARADLVAEAHELAFARGAGTKIGAECLLGADRLGDPLGEDRTGVLVARERVQMSPERRSQCRSEGTLVERGHVA